MFSPRPGMASLVLVLGMLMARALCQAAAPDVRLEERGEQVILDNGIVTATIDKAHANVTSLKYRDIEMVSQGGRKRNVYFSMDGGADYRQPKDCVFTVKSASPEMVDVACTRVWKDEPQAFDIEAHFVLRRGVPGLHVYAILRHPAAYPATRYGEWRMVWRTPELTDDWICVDDERHWRMPDPADYKTAEKTPIKEITKLTQGVRAGQYDCKYDFSASYHDIGCWGHAFAKAKVGAWIVCGGYDFFNDGPTQQDLNAAAGINHIHFGRDHYGGSTLSVAAGETWSKIYGPYLMYCNGAEQVEAMWEDARQRVKQEKAAWPYAWLTGVPEHPAPEARGSVTGKLVIKEPQWPVINGSDAWIGLSQPGPGGNWQSESKHYQYWTRTDLDGSFTLSGVRPGTYTLSAFSLGAVGEFTQTGIEVRAGEDTTPADLVWNVPHAGRMVWHIGTPDRSAAEFANAWPCFHGYSWLNFSKTLPNPLEFTIGQSDPMKDWNYAHSGYGQDKLMPWKWRIHFDLAAAPQGDATLVLAIASADGARVDVFANDEARPVTTVTPAVQGGNALLRESTHAKYGVERVTLPAGVLRQGKNVITLVQKGVKGFRQHVMYDAIVLEVP